MVDPSLVYLRDMQLKTDLQLEDARPPDRNAAEIDIRVLLQQLSDAKALQSSSS